MTETMSLRDYIARMKDRGLFADAAAFAEHSPAILHDFFDRMRPYDYDGLSVPVTVVGDRYALWRDPLDDERVGLNWALSTCMVDVALPGAAGDFDARHLADEVGDIAVMTDTFSFIDGYTALGPALNSPVAAFGTDYAAYVESLSQERRKKYRRLVKDFEGYALDFSLTHEPLTDAELTWAYDSLYSKWGDYSALYAFSSILWPQAVAAHRPDDVLHMRVRDKGRLMFIQTVVRRHGGYYALSIARDPEADYDGIAPYTDFKTIEGLCAKGPSFFDPSCRTGFEDPESIGIAKRATVNRDAVKPVFLAGRSLPQPYADIAQTPTLHGKAA